MPGELTTPGIVARQIGGSVTADPDPAVGVLVYAAWKGGRFGMDRSEILESVLFGIEAEEVAGIGCSYIETPRAAQPRRRGIVRVGHFGDKLPEAPGFGIDLQHKKIVCLLPHRRVNAGSTLAVAPRMQSHPIDRPHRDAEIADAGIVYLCHIALLITFSSCCG